MQGLSRFVARAAHALRRRLLERTPVIRRWNSEPLGGRGAGSANLMSSFILFVCPLQTISK
jgi:hypothetical protein